MLRRLLLSACLLGAASLAGGSASTSASVLHPLSISGYPYATVPCTLKPYALDGPSGWCPGLNWGLIPGDQQPANELSPYGYYYRNCTDYVAWRLTQNGVPLWMTQGLGDAKTWAVVAKQRHLPVDPFPAVGSVAVNPTGKYGHVAVVTAVSGGYISVEQYDVNFDGDFSTSSGYPSSLGFTRFIHFERYATGLAPTPASFAAAVQARAGVLFTASPSASPPVQDLHLGLRHDAAPAMVTLSGGGTETAVVANTGHLFTIGVDGTRDWALPVAAGSAPAIAALAGGGYEVAFAHRDGDLVVVGTKGTADLHVPVAPGTNPSITGLANGGYELAAHLSSGGIYESGAAGTRLLHLGVATGTSPAIAGLVTGGAEVVFQANTGTLYGVGAAGSGSLGQQLAPTSSPVIAALSTGGDEVAFVAATGPVATTGTAGTRSWHLVPAPGTNPAITALASGGFEVALQLGNGSLMSVGTAGSKNWHLQMAPQTSPTIA